MPKRNDDRNEIAPEKYKLREVQNSAGGNFNTATRMEGQLGDHEIHMVRRSKRDGSARTSREERESEMLTRLQLKQLGVSVIPTLRIDEKGDMYSTDLTEKGKKFVLSWTNTPFDSGEFDEALYSDEFSKPYPRRKDVLAEVAKIAKNCADSGVSIENADGLFLVIDKKTRDTKVLAGDYKHFKKLADPPPDLLQRNLGNCYMLFGTRQMRILYGFASTEEIKSGLGIRV